MRVLDSPRPCLPQCSRGPTWEPDEDCVAAGDEALNVAVRRYAAARMSDRQITVRVQSFVGEPSEVSRCTPPWCCITEIVAACADSGQDFDAISRILAVLSTKVPGWPDDPDELAAIIDNTLKGSRP